MKYDVVEVSTVTNKIVAVVSENLSERNAEAVVMMAVTRRGVDTSFFSEVPHGKYKEGDTWLGNGLGETKDKHQGGSTLCGDGGNS